MKYWKELPYRGDGESKESKPRRRFRNMKIERREIAISIFAILMFGFVVFGCFALSPDANNTFKIVGIVIGAFFILTLIIGVLSASKFRKGFDVDISEETEKDKPSENSNNRD